MVGVTQGSNVAAFPLSFLQKKNDLVKKLKSNMKVIIGVSNAYWHVYLR